MQAQLEMHSVVVPGQVALLGEPLVAFEALVVLARLAVVNASFVVAQIRVELNRRRQISHCGPSSRL
jgi:hypothetical protein